MLDREPKAVSECVGRLVTQEAVQHLDDLFMRRTDWGTLPDLAITLAKRIVPLLGWDENRRAQELKHLEAVLAGRSHDKSCS